MLCRGSRDEYCHYGGKRAWFAEAAEVPKSRVTEAKKEALSAPSTLAAQSAAIRRIVPWEIIRGEYAIVTRQPLTSQPLHLV